MAEGADTLWSGRLVLRQAPGGHKAGTDTVLLAAAVPPGGARLILDFGASTGAVGLLAALRVPSARVRLVEIDPAAAALAGDNVVRNGLGDRVTVIVADLLAPHSERAALGLCGGDADLVLANPPYLDPARSRASPDAARRSAHAMDSGALGLWAGAALDALAPKGRFALIHRADALEAVLAALGRRFGAVRIRPVHPRSDQPATRILVDAVKGSRAPLTVLPGLVLHEANGRFTPLAAALHRGEASLDDQPRGVSQRGPAGSP